MSVAALLVPGLYVRYLPFGLQGNDATAPTVTVTPVAGSVGHTHIQVVGTATDANEPITLYIVAVANAAAAPSAAQVAAGTDSTDTPAPRAYNDASASGVAVSATIAGLSASTAYDVYYTFGDAYDNLVASAKLDISTTAAPSYDQNAIVRVNTSSARMIRAAVDEVT